ncbi:MAG: hypothetical protein JSW25_04605 [Thermoplasmata archaeon]|nr:MAG: hypothetical protein JSW25_04605 [Thermoplasmata archaeon]
MAEGLILLAKILVVFTFLALCFLFMAGLSEADRGTGSTRAKRSDLGAWGFFEVLFMTVALIYILFV